MLTVDSMDRRRFEGDDMVVPRELVREWPRRCEEGMRGSSTGVDIPEELGEERSTREPTGMLDIEPEMLASMSCGGRRSFSMSTLRASSKV